MATSSMSMQSVLFSSMPGGKTSPLLPSVQRLPCQKRNVGIVRCMDKKQTTSSPPAPKIFDVLAFSGPAPERINGRLAMIGFVAAIATELARGDDVAVQLANGGIPLFIGSTILLSLASLIPLLKGVSVESKSEGVMTSYAEMVNGRFAMLGLVALVFTEFIKGGALV